MRERASRPARADRRQPRERHSLPRTFTASASSTSRPRALDVAGADGQDEVARPRPGRDEPARRPRRPAPSPARMPGRSASTTSLPSTPAHRLLARAVDLGHAGRVGRRQRGAELVREVAGAGVEVRLEEHEHAARRALARRGDGRLDLRRMMGVVVDDRDAVLLADELEAAARRRGSVRAPARRRRARRPRARVRRAPSRHCAGCAHPAARARTTPARAPSRARPAAPRRASRRTSPRPRPPTRTWSGGRARRS